MTDTIKPSDLLRLWHEGIRPGGPVALDTETSGLFADDGARVSVVSLAWETSTRLWGEATYSTEEYAGADHTADIASVAWPFDQGLTGTGKPEDKGQDALWSDADNLPEREWEDLLEWLVLVGEHGDGLIMHNAKFDLEKMRVGVRRWPGRGAELEDYVEWDTQNVNHLLWPLEPTSLKPTSARLFGSQAQDEQKIVKEYLRRAKLPAGRWDLMPWDIVGPYADMDARLTLMLYLRQIHEIERGAGAWLNRWEGDRKNGVMRAIDRRHQTMLTLYRMERRGVPYDARQSRSVAVKAGARAADLAAVLPFQPPSGPAATRYFFTDEEFTDLQGKKRNGLDLPPYATTATGAASLTAEVVDRMVADQVPWANEWREYKKVTTAASMWYLGYSEKVGLDGRLRATFRQNGTASTRFSVERVNLQAIPQDYRLGGYESLAGLPTPRDLIAAAVPAGWRLWELDLAQAELRVAAMWAGCQRMLQMISEDADLHTYTTKALFPEQDPDGPEFKSKWRQVGKRANFSLIFGAGPDTFKRMVSKETGIMLTDSQAYQTVRAWNRLYPEFEAAIDKHSVKVIRRMNRHGYGWIDLPTGERRWFKGDEDPHKAFNQRVQPALAQFGISWMLESEEYLTTDPRVALEIASMQGQTGSGEGGLVLTIHDSQVLLLPDNAVGAGAAEWCANTGRRLWAEMFPGVPGDVDFKPWGGA